MRGRRVAVGMMADLAAWNPASTVVFRRGASGQPTSTDVERSLWEASERALRQPKGRSALVVHLSRLSPPAPRSYHTRVARALLQDSAAHFDGQVFVLRNQDLVLFCHQSGARADASRPAPTDVVKAGRSACDGIASSPDLLPAVLGKLFSTDADPATLTSFWRLDQDSSGLLGYLAEQTGGPVSDDAWDKPSDTVLSAAALQGILAKAPLSDLMVQQTGMSLDSDRSKSLADRLAPAFRELSVSLAALELGPVVSCATADPFLSRYLASGFDARVVALLAEDLAVSGKLTRTSIQARLPIHINLGLETILSPGFTRLSRLAAASGVRLGASISLMQACADLDLMDHARQVLTLTGAELILSHVDPAALALVKPARLQPDVVKIVWSSSLLTSSAAEKSLIRNESLFDGAHLGTVVLQNVESHHALAWGQAHGISCFQGVFLDQVQAATRMARCHHASGCTVRQCATRASASAASGRVGCFNPGLLDAEDAAKTEMPVLCP